MGADAETDRQTDRQPDSQTDRQTDRRTDGRITVIYEVELYGPLPLKPTTVDNLRRRL